MGTRRGGVVVVIAGTRRFMLADVRRGFHDAFGVTIIALLAAQALIAAIHTLQFLHILPFSLGQMTVFGFDLLAALLWAASAAAYLWAGRMLWRMEESGWMFAVLLSGWIVILDLVELIGVTPLQAVLPSLVVAAAVLAYCLWPGTKDAFYRAPSGISS
jgi:hypothetical protein